MTDTTDKVIDLASKKMDELGTQLSALAHQYGPDVVQSALQVARIDAAQHALNIIIFTCLVICGWGGFSRVLRWDLRTNTDSDRGFPSTVCAVIMAIFSVIYLLFFVDIWPFIGVYEPKLWIAHKLLNLG